MVWSFLFITLIHKLYQNPQNFCWLTSKVCPLPNYFLPSPLFSLLLGTVALHWVVILPAPNCLFSPPVFRGVADRMLLQYLKLGNITDLLRASSAFILCSGQKDNDPQESDLSAIHHSDFLTLIFGHFLDSSIPIMVSLLSIQTSQTSSFMVLVPLSKIQY